MRTHFGWNPHQTHPFAPKVVCQPACSPKFFNNNFEQPSKCRSALLRPVDVNFVESRNAHHSTLFLVEHNHHRQHEIEGEGERVWGVEVEKVQLSEFIRHGVLLHVCAGVHDSGWADMLWYFRITFKYMPNITTLMYQVRHKNIHNTKNNIIEESMHSL